MSAVPSLFTAFKDDQHIHLCALHVHIGSPIFSAKAYLSALTRIEILIDEIHANGGTVSLLDFGGGFPAFYEKNIGPRSNSMLEFAATY